MDEVEAVLAGQLDQAGEKGKFDALGGRIRREVDDEGLGARGHARDEVFKLGKKFLGVHDGDADHVRPCDDGAVDVDGIAGVGHQHGVARVEDGEAEVGDALLGADGDDGLAVGIEIDVVTRLVPIRDGPAKTRQAARNRVAMRDGLLRRFNHLVDDVFGRGPVGVAHAEVDDVFSRGGGRKSSYSPRDVEDIRRKATPNAAELFHGNQFTGTGIRGQGTVHSSWFTVLRRAVRTLGSSGGV